VRSDDHRLIAECLQGRTAAFGELVRRYQDRLFNTAYRLLDNAEDAHDAVQEAFLRAYQCLDQFKGDALFFTWLYRIAVNEALGQKRKRRVMLPIGVGRDHSGESPEPMDRSDYARPGRAVEMQEEERWVQDALNRLSPEHRAVLVLKDIEDQKYEVIAEVLQIPIGTVRSRLHRARLELRQLLEASDPTDSHTGRSFDSHRGRPPGARS
jgi:RNA polymerase sigma-70 factor (ECF subfamily)